MMKRASSLLRNSRGAATIELAIAASMLATMLVGVIDLSKLYSDKLMLEQVGQRVIERVQQSGFTTSQETTLETEAETEAGSGSDADLTFWIECNGVKQTGSSAYTNGCSDGETIARYVEMDIEKTFTPIILASFGGANPNGTFTVHGISGIRIQ